MVGSLGIHKGQHRSRRQQDPIMDQKGIYVDPTASDASATSVVQKIQVLSDPRSCANTLQL